MAMPSSASSHIVELDYGLTVRFPFEPYKGQVSIMNSVLECIYQRKNGLIESPTGSGKTLALLCSALSWQQNERATRQKEIQAAGPRVGSSVANRSNSGAKLRENVPPIIFASRTHSQLSQAIRALKSTSYKSVKALVLGSRDLMCIHEEVSRLENSAAKNNICHAKVRARSCAYYNNVVKRKDDPMLREPTIVDIEDIVKRGRSAKFCPFFMSRELVKEAEIVFMPYNYLLDPKLRTSQGIEIKNAVIILDEGHNITKICEDAVSFELRSSLVAACIQEVTKVLLEYASLGPDEKPLHEDLKKEDLIHLKKCFLSLEEELDAIKLASEKELLPAKDLLDAFIKSGFSRNKLARIIAHLDAISSLLSVNSRDTCACDKFGSILRVISSQSEHQIRFSNNYQLYVEREGVKNSKYLSSDSNPAKVFHCWCLNPGLGLETLLAQQPRCVLLCSGTLTPMKHLEDELMSPFPVQMSAPHVIGDNQLFTVVLKTGPENVRLLSNFENRNNPTYLFELGQVVVKVCSVVPKGVLVFFPSYVTLDVCSKAWNENGIWNELNMHKKVFVEPQRKDTFNQVMDNYYAAVRTGNGACLMAVCRGKVSEGLDFSDDNGRAVIITGIPYPPAKDPRVIAKQEYLNRSSFSLHQAGKPNSLNGRLWYQLEGSRALSQAVGRIIRHVNDYGAILFCDERCSFSDFRNQVSGWIFAKERRFQSFDQTLNELAGFFGSNVQVRIGHAISRKQRITPNIQPPKHWTEPISEHELYFDQEESKSRICCKKLQQVESASTSLSKLWDNPTANNTTPANINKTTMFDNIGTESSKGSGPSAGLRPAFNSQLPVFTKSFAAFVKSDARSPEEGIKRRKIKLTKTNSSFPAFDNNDSDL